MPKFKKKNATARKSHNKEISRRKVSVKLLIGLLSFVAGRTNLCWGHGSSEDRFYGSEQSCFGTQCSTNNLKG